MTERLLVTDVTIGDRPGRALLVVGGLIALAQGSALAPFIYTIF